MPGMDSGLARAYAVITLTASADSGPFLLEAKNWRSWRFNAYANGTVTSAQLTIYGTNDPLTAGALGNPNLAIGYAPTPFVSAGRWTALVAPSGQTESAGTYSNPITQFNGSQELVYQGPLMAVRATTNAFTGGGSIVLQAYAVS